MRRLLPLVFVAAAALTASSASARPVTYVSFRTPSKNIYCAYSSGLGARMNFHRPSRTLRRSLQP